MEYKLYLAWLTANLSQAKKIPKFNDLLPRKKLETNNRKSRFKMEDHEIDIHLARFKSERKVLLIG